MADVQGSFPGKLAPGKIVSWTKLVGGGAAGGGGGAGIERSISSTFEAQLGDKKQATRVALVRLGESDIALIFFSLVAPDPTARAAYEKASEQVIASIEPIGK
jgi:hypothetical protein